jgi:hypothetical protein
MVVLDCLCFALSADDIRPSPTQAMDTPGPQHYVPLEGFAQKPKLRLTRGPANSKIPKGPTHVFPVCLVFSCVGCIDNPHRHPSGPVPYAYDPASRCAVGGASSDAGFRGKEQKVSGISGHDVHYQRNDKRRHRLGPINLEQTRRGLWQDPTQGMCVLLLLSLVWLRPYLLAREN